jgi:hypothetical protein
MEETTDQGTEALEAVLAAYPTDQIDADNLAQFRGFWERKLLINRCDDCQAWHQPPQPLCPKCWSESLTATQVSGSGTIHMAMMLHQGPGIEAGKPLPVVVVELPEQEGLRFTAALVDNTPEQAVIGQGVSLGWTESSGAPWPVFRPVEGS